MPTKSTNYNLASSLKIATYFLAIVISGLIFPMILIFITHFTGYSEIIEEIAKASVILFFILNIPKFKWQIFITIIFAFLFGLSESILYLNNIFQIGNFNIFWQRFLTAVPMHIVTSLIILFSARFGKKFIFIGLTLAVALHLFYNILILSLK